MISANSRRTGRPTKVEQEVERYIHPSLLLVSSGSGCANVIIQSELRSSMPLALRERSAYRIP